MRDMASTRLSVKQLDAAIGMMDRWNYVVVAVVVLALLALLLFLLFFFLLLLLMVVVDGCQWDDGQVDL